MPIRFPATCFNDLSIAPNAINRYSIIVQLPCLALRVRFNVANFANPAARVKRWARGGGAIPERNSERAAVEAH